LFELLDIPQGRKKRTAMLWDNQRAGETALLATGMRFLIYSSELATKYCWNARVTTQPHSMDQCEMAAQRFGQYRYSLWTGDIGLAIFLWGCINGDDRIPTQGNVRYAAEGGSRFGG
jgi:hypothetical protein